MTLARILGLLACLSFGVAAPAPALAQAPSPQQAQQIADFSEFLRTFEAQAGALPPAVRQSLVDAASDAILRGTYPSFIAGLRQSMATAPGQTAQRPPQRRPMSGPESVVVGMRVFFLQRSPLGLSHGSGYVHFCPNDVFYETSEATIQSPQSARAGSTGGVWRIEQGRQGPVVAMYFQHGRRAGDRIEYTLAQMQSGRWRTTNWDYAVDRVASC